MRITTGSWGKNEPQHDGQRPSSEWDRTLAGQEEVHQYWFVPWKADNQLPRRKIVELVDQINVGRRRGVWLDDIVAMTGSLYGS